MTTHTDIVPGHLIERIKKINTVIFDIDGVLTDGRIIYANSGNELKFFDVQDGFGAILLKRAGFKTFIMTAKKSKVVKLRGKDMQVSGIYQNCFDKLKTFNEITAKFKLDPENICYIGDDLIDLPVLKRVGFAVSVPNAMDEVKNGVHYVTKKKGGRGAVRELCDIILKAQNKWESVTAKYFR